MPPSAPPPKPNDGCVAEVCKRCTNHPLEFRVILFTIMYVPLLWTFCDTSSYGPILWLVDGLLGKYDNVVWTGMVFLPTYFILLSTATYLAGVSVFNTIAIIGGNRYNVWKEGLFESLLLGSFLVYTMYYEYKELGQRSRGYLSMVAKKFV